MKKLFLSAAVCAAAAFLSACSLINPLSAFEETAVVIDKSGSIKELVVESFSEGSYSEDEFDSFIKKQASDYNTAAGGEEKVKIESVSLKSGKLRLEVSYKAASDYEAFNKTVFKVEDGAEWLKKEISVQAENARTFKTADKEMRQTKQLGNLSGKTAVVANGPFLLRVPGKILYVSDNVSVTDEKTAEISGGDSVIIYE